MDFVQEFYESTEKLPSPKIFRKWTGIALAAAALERKVWIRAFGEDFYANLYIILVATPGVGKSILITRARRYWSKLGTHHLAAASLTKASLIDNLNDAQRNIIIPNGSPSSISFNSLIVAADEFSVFMPAYESDFMSVLNAIYDNHPYSEKRRSNKIDIDIPKPQLNIFGGTQPGYLKTLLPEGAWDQGFTSRIIFIYSGDQQLRDPLAEAEESNVNESLLQQLKAIGSLHGKMTFSPEAAAAVKEWHFSGRKPEPEHPKLYHYCTRRLAHILKLSMVSCASRGAHPQIELIDFERALEWLLDAENTMPDIFRAMTSGGDGRTIEDTWHYVYSIFGKENRPITEARLVNFLSERTPAHNISRLIEVMVKAGILKEGLEPKVGKCYTPARKRHID